MFCMPHFLFYIFLSLNNNFFRVILNRGNDCRSFAIYNTVFILESILRRENVKEIGLYFVEFLVEGLFPRTWHSTSTLVLITLGGFFVVSFCVASQPRGRQIT